jgi:hypothetical protein
VLLRLAYDFAEANSIKNNFNSAAELVGKDRLTQFLKGNHTVSSKKPELTGMKRINAFIEGEVLPES